MCALAGHSGAIVNMKSQLQIYRLTIFTNFSMLNLTAKWIWDRSIFSIIGVSASSVLIQRYGINARPVLTSRTEVDWESGVVMQMWSKGLFRFRLWDQSWCWPLEYFISTDSTCVTDHALFIYCQGSFIKVLSICRRWYKQQATRVESKFIYFEKP